MNTHKTIDDYIQSFPEDIQETLKKIRQTIKEEALNAEEKISYGMPTFWQGKNIIHFAAFKKHISIFPTSSRIEDHVPEVAQFRTGKGTFQFPIDKPFPFDLLRKVVQVRLKEV